MTVEQELLALKGKSEILTAESVVDWAKANPQSRLHAQFEWNDRKAAQEYRIWQARKLIAIYVSFDGETRRLISLSIDRVNEGGGYRDMNDVLSNKALTEIMLADALADLNRIELKYQRLTALKPIWKEVKKIRRRVAKPEHIASHSVSPPGGA